ncbi:MAG: efflux RND transporter periplasmic adaptor subunit [Methylomonas sp.]|uniref:efflux RND transporter periplasmic adaptor subunit n=1 Tax=Methylomonas sp. TaxID=418 RepID=UPI0025F063CB|nr:efflux RND transporter periplasmic adaptor subunit [Methylomonas sp.]MCK9608244.1 efflux RND transporter periplasmic adaptor subunit [Methylomonas sp.]
MILLVAGCSDSSDGAKPVAKLPSVPGEVFLAADSPKKAYVKTAPLTLSRHPLLQPLAGKVTYNENQTASISSPIAGRVMGTPIALGTHVQVGTTLLALNSPDAAAAEADFVKAQADLTLASHAYKRQQELFAGKAIAQKELEQAQDALSSARSELQRSQNRLKNLQLPVQQSNGRFALRSPLAGIVVERRVTPGMEIRPDLDSPLFVVSDIKKLTLLMEVFEVNLSKIRIGQSLSVSVPAYPGETFPATVHYIGQVLDEATRTVQVRCDLPNPDSRLLPGMYATINVDSNPDDLGIMVPLAAVFTEGEANYVFIQLEDNHFQQRKVELALRLKDKALITSGVKPGELLVTEGALMLRAEEEVDSDTAQP